MMLYESSFVTHVPISLMHKLKSRGSLIRNFRTVLNDNMDLQLDEEVDEPSVFVRDMVISFGPEQRRPLGW